MKSNLDRLIAILKEIEALTKEDREALFIALTEEYQWAPEISAGTDRGVGIEDFGWKDDFSMRDYDVILVSGGKEPLPILRLIRKKTDLSPMESKDLLSSLPAVVKHQLSMDEAIELRECFLVYGAQAEICESTHTQGRLSELSEGKE